MKIDIIYTVSWEGSITSEALDTSEKYFDWTDAQIKPDIIKKNITNIIVTTFIDENSGFLFLIKFANNGPSADAAIAIEKV